MVWGTNLMFNLVFKESMLDILGSTFKQFMELLPTSCGACQRLSSYESLKQKIRSPPKDEV